MGTLRKDDEIEISFSPKVSKLTLDKYITLLKFFSKANKPIEISDTLNVSFSYDYDVYNSYRITIKDLDNINKVTNNLSSRENHVIFLMLYEQYKLKKYPYISMIEKKKSKDNITDIEELGIRVRLAKELEMNTDTDINLTYSDRKYINFRYIQRASLIIEDTPEYTLRVDLSYVKSSDKIGLLETKSPMIELEIDLTLKKDVKASILKALPMQMNTTFNNVRRVLQKSNIITTKSDQENTLLKLNTLLSPDKAMNMRDLPGMQSGAAEITHIVDYIGHHYCVTDKADGDRHFMIIHDGKIMLISNTLDVKQIESVKGTEEYNDTILDGEYMFNDKHQKFMFLAFDCLMFKGVDKRLEKNLIVRLDFVRDITKNLFGQKYGFTKYSGEFDFPKMKKYYTNDVKKHMDELNIQLSKKSVNIISMKYFMIPQGVHLCEIFFLTALTWNLYTNNSIIKCPYTLDGCMLTPLEQIYVRSQKEQTHKIYKIKPSQHNSLDLYITFERDPMTRQIIDIYDDSESNNELYKLDKKQFTETVELIDESKLKAKGQMYRVVNLHVGKMTGNTEYPVLFHEREEQHFANLYIVDNEVRDMEGDIIQDKTVVEFIYINDPLLKPGSRWKPLRTRYDKTESVNTFKRKYGNNDVIAEKTWRSMIDGIEMSSIELLGDPLTYEAQHNKLRSLITTTMIERERRENSYYSLITDLAQPLRHFHNYIKSQLITIYCGPKDTKQGLKALDILDYGCGKGGDIGKFLMARLKSYVGFDYDYNGIHSGSDGAISRYQTYKRKMNVISFKTDFMVADGGVLLNPQSQEQSMGEVSTTNIALLKQYFDPEKPKLYDAISCQFAVHYFFKNDETLKNFMANITRLIKPSGYVVLTTFDDETVDTALQDGPITSHYTTKEGDKKIIFDVIKKYDGKLQNITGQSIDVHLPSFQDEEYTVEYIVPKQLLVDKMTDNGFKLIDTNMFWNVFNTHKEFFQNGVQYEEKAAMKKFYMGVKEYYNSSDTMNQSCYKFTKQSRYYVFQKENNMNIQKKFESTLDTKYTFKSDDKKSYDKKPYDKKKSYDKKPYDKRK
jgi:SAM-dependent methyltransferase